MKLMNVTKFLFINLCLLALVFNANNANAQRELLQGGSMNEGDSSHWNIAEKNGFGGGTPSVEFGREVGTCELCEGGGLYISQEQLIGDNSGITIYQEVTIDSGHTYNLEGILKDITGNTKTGFWAQLRIGHVQPADTGDWEGTGTIVMAGFNPWVVAGEIEEGESPTDTLSGQWTFQDNCATDWEGQWNDTLTCGTWQMPDTLRNSSGDVVTDEDGNPLKVFGEQETMYFAINIGYCCQDTIQYDVIFDEVSLVDQDQEPAITNVEEKSNPDKLLSNSPNPFSGETQVNYTVPERGKVELAVYNVMGEKVATLVNGTKSKGSYQTSFNAPGGGSQLYITKLKVNGRVATEKMISK